MTVSFYLKYSSRCLAILLFLFSGCSEVTEGGGATDNPIPLYRSFEMDGEVIDQFYVNNTIFHIPQRYSVTPPTDVKLT